MKDFIFDEKFFAEAKSNAKEPDDIPQFLNVVDKKEFTKYIFLTDAFMQIFLDRKLDVDNFENDINELFDRLMDLADNHVLPIFGMLASAIIELFPELTLYQANLYANAYYNTFADVYAKDKERFYPISLADASEDFLDKNEGF